MQENTRREREKTMGEEDLSVCELVLKELDRAEFELKSRHDRRVIQRLEERVREIYLQKEGEG